MNANVRRAEIVRTMMGRRKSTMCELAEEFGVTDRTIRSDVTLLMTEYPFETMRGSGGGIMLPDSYRPNKHLLSERQKQAIKEAIPNVCPVFAVVLREILEAFG